MNTGSRLAGKRSNGRKKRSAPLGVCRKIRVRVCVRRVYARGLRRFKIEIEGTGSQGEYLLPGGRYSQRSWGAVWRMYLALLRRPWPLHFHPYGAGAAGRRETPVAVYTSRAAVDIENKPRKFVATERRRRRATRWRNVCGQCHARRLEREPHRPS